MKRNSFVVTLPLLAMLVTASAVQAAPQSSPFSGTWIGTDALDGSTVHMVVQGGANARIAFDDEFGTACADIGATDLWFSASLHATVDGTTMTGAFKSAKCGHTALSFMRRQPMVWILDDHGTANPADDTMSDGVDAWSRV
jgi:hypothetical protein